MFKVGHFSEVQRLAASLPSMAPRAIAPTEVTRVDLHSLFKTIECLPLHVVMAFLAPGSRSVHWSLPQAI